MACGIQRWPLQTYEVRMVSTEIRSCRVQAYGSQRVAGRGDNRMLTNGTGELRLGFSVFQSLVLRHKSGMHDRVRAYEGGRIRRQIRGVEALSACWVGRAQLGGRTPLCFNEITKWKSSDVKQYNFPTKSLGITNTEAGLFPDVAGLIITAVVVVRLAIGLHQFARNQQSLTNVEGFAELIEASEYVSLHENERQRVNDQGSFHWQQAGRVARRMLMIWAAAVCLTWWAGAGPVLASESNAGALVQPLVGEAKATLKVTLAAMWPKTQQVLEVLRDQGLLLSVLLSLSAFFSMAETSITTLWPWKVRELAEKEGEGGVFHVLRQDVTRFLTTILIGTTVVNIAATAMVTEAATALFGEAGVTAATGVMTVVLLLLTEIAPKSIAVHNATEVARVVVRPVAWLSVVLYPVGRVVTAMSTSLLKLLGLKSSGEPFVSEEELKLMLRGAELSGAIEEEEQDMIENVLEIKDTYVREVMTPLVDVVAIDGGATLMEFRNLWVKHQYSRVPVFERRIDNIVGIAYAMDMLDYVEQGELLQRMPVGRIAHRPAYFVPDSMSVWNLLREFRIRKVHMAIVLNEYGGTVGVVTLEDVVEEIVGEIFDENDSKEEIRKKTGYVVQRADGVFDVDANTSIEDLADSLEVKLPEGPYHYETVSGFVCEAFGYIPRTGESTKVVLRKADAEEGSDRRDGEGDHQEDRRDKFQKYRLEILAGNARKVGSVRFERKESTQGKEDHDSRLPRALRRSREEDNEKDSRSAVEDHHWVDPEESPSEEDSDDEICRPSEDESKDSPDYYLPESVRCGNEQAAVISAGLSLGGMQDWDMETVQDEMRDGMETVDELDESTASVVGNINNKWEEEERQVERRRSRRRKQSAEAALELNKQRRSDLRRREAEAELAMATPRRSREEHEQTESYQETGK